MSTLLGRSVALEFGERGKPGKRISGLTVLFDIHLSRKSAPNTGTITVKNLSESSVSLLQQPGAVVRLLAGYDVPRQLIEAEIPRGGVTSTMEAGTRVTVIELTDAGPQIAGSIVQIARSGSVSASDVVADAIESLGLGKGSIELPDMSWPDGMSYTGSASDILDRVASTLDGSWWIDDGVVHMSASTTPTRDSALVLSAKNKNLIGSPARTDSGVFARALLDAGLRPGRKFVIDSEHVAGAFVATDVRFVGDSWSGAWYVEVDGVPL